MFQVLLPQQQQQLQPQQRTQPRNLRPHGIMKKLSNGKEFHLGLLPFPNIMLLPKYFFNSHAQNHSDFSENSLKRSD